MAKKIANLVVTLLFVLFAYFQLNDHDPIKWIVLYGYVAMVAGLAAFEKLPRNIALVGAILGTIWLAYLVPDLIDWISKGMPSITESMKAESPYVELTREFFGVLISIAALWWYYYKGKR